MTKQVKTPEIVKRVARAIYAAQYPHDIDEHNPGECAECHEHARAAIEAMRSLPPHVCQAAAEKAIQSFFSRLAFELGLTFQDDVDHVWLQPIIDAAIDAALGEGSKK